MAYYLDPQNMPAQRNIRFYWAVKHLLLNKANYKILEGFLSELLKENVTIITVSNRESSQDHPENIFNRVDILVENDHEELFSRRTRTTP